MTSKHLDICLLGRRSRLILLNACFVLVLVCILYFYYTGRAGRLHHDFISTIFTPSKCTYDNSHVIAITEHVTLYQPVRKVCERLAYLRMPSNVSLPMCIYDPADDVYISASIRSRGEWEPAIIQAITYLFQLDFNVSNQVQRKNVYIPNDSPSLSSLNGAEYEFKEEVLSMLDLGCNIGAFTLSLASMGYQVLAVDAMEESLQLLATSIRLNNLSSLVTLVHNAVSDVRGPVHVQVNTKNKGASFIKQDWLNNNTNASDSVRKAVSGVCLDDFVPHVRTGRVFLKMDIEGFEAKALRCAGEFFKMIDVPFVLMEWVFHKNNFNGAYIIDFFTSRGLTPYDSPKSVKSLVPGSYISWPENVFWIRRK